MASQFVSATPLLASLDIGATLDFYASKLGFEILYSEQGVYGIVSQGGVQLHFWACSDRRIAEATACRVQVTDIELLYAHCKQHHIVHPRGALATQPWGNQEFGVLDPDGNLVTFYQPVASAHPPTVEKS